jgi:hypothetical protein
VSFATKPVSLQVVALAGVVLGYRQKKNGFIVTRMLVAMTYDIAINLGYCSNLKVVAIRCLSHRHSLRLCCNSCFATFSFSWGQTVIAMGNMLVARCFFHNMHFVYP